MPSESQANLVRALARIGLGSDHLVMLDTTAGVASHNTLDRRLSVNAPFLVKQRDYDVDGQFGYAEVRVEPLIEGPLRLRLTMQPNVGYEQWPELRRAMSAGDMSVFGADPRVLLSFGITCGSNPELAEYMKLEGSALPVRDVRLALTSESALLEHIGALEAIARLRAVFPGREFGLKSSRLRILTDLGRIRITGALLPHSTPALNPLALAAAFYVQQYDVMAERHPVLLDLKPRPATFPLPSDLRQLREAYEREPRIVLNRPTAREFRVQCPGGELTIEGYDTAPIAPAPRPPELVEAPATPITVRDPQPLLVAESTLRRPNRAERRAEKAKRRALRAGQPAVDAKPLRE